MMRLPRLFIPIAFLTLVGNPGQTSGQEAAHLTAREVLRVGSLDGPQALTYVHSLAVTPAGIFAGQNMDRVIRHFDPEGDLLNVIGRPGRGPGEFLRVSRIGYVDQELVVVDEQQSRTTHFTADGTLVTTRQLAFPEAPPRTAGPGQWLAPVHPAVKGRFVWIAGVDARRVPEMPVRPAVLASADGSILADLPSIHRRDRGVLLTSGEGTISMTRPFHNGTRYGVASNGRFFAVADPDGSDVVIQRIDLETLDKHVHGVRVTLRRVPGTAIDDIVERYSEGALSAAGQQMRDAFWITDPVSIQDLAVLSDGTVWVSMVEFEGPDRLWYRIDPRTRRMATVHLPWRFRILAGDGPYLWGVELGDHNVPYVVKFEVGESPLQTRPGSSALARGSHPPP